MTTKKIKEQCSKEVQELISMGLLEVTAVDEKGNFCYGCTEDGLKVARGEANMPDKKELPA